MTGKKQFLLFSVLALGLMAGLSRVKQTQDNRGSAYFDKTTSSILPSTGSVKVGEKITASLWLNTTAKVDFVKSKWCASNNSLIPVEGSLSAVTPFATILFSNIEGSCISFAIKAEVPSTQLKTGVFQVATVKFEAKSVSTFVSVNISPVETEISGFKPKLG